MATRTCSQWSQPRVSFSASDGMRCHAGRARPGAAVCHPGAEAHCDTATGSARYHHRDPVVPGPQRYRRQRESRRVGQGCGRGARYPRGGMAELQPQRPDGSACDAPPTIPLQPQARDLGEEVGGGAPVGWRPHLQEEVPHAKEPEARYRGGRQHQEARLTVLPDQDGALPDGAVPQLDKEAAHPTVLVVPVPGADAGAPLQGVFRVEGPAEDPLGGGEEGDREGEGQVEGPGPTGG